MAPQDGRDGPDQEHPAPVIITDKRHSRALDEMEEAASAPAPPEPPAAPPAPEPEGVVEFTRPAPSAPAVEAPAAPEPPSTQPDDSPVADEPLAEEEAYAAAEMEHLRMLFGAGLVQYLRGQMGLLLNFALLGLGRAPNPATGLVSTELDKAKLAIDLLEFIAVRLRGQLPETEEQEIAQVLAELKYTFMQLAAANPAPPAGGEA